AARLKVRFGADRAEAVDDIAAAARAREGIVNATPVDIPKLPRMPLKSEDIAPRHGVADILYFPLETELLRHARRLGCQTVSGEGMAVFQGVRAFELFTGVEPNIDVMRGAFAHFDRASAE